MEKQPIKPFDLWMETLVAAIKYGLLLCTNNAEGKPNVMAVGSIAAGVFWGKSLIILMIRPSCYTFNCLEASGEFTLNVLPPGWSDAIAFCGMTSGRKEDKFAKMGLTPLPAQKVQAPIIAQGLIHYECRVAHHHEIAPADLAEEIKRAFYPEGNFSHFYFGEVVAAYAAPDAHEQFRR